jgi:hypothetical protein
MPRIFYNWRIHVYTTTRDVQYVSIRACNLPWFSDMICNTMCIQSIPYTYIYQWLNWLSIIFQSEGTTWICSSTPCCKYIVYLTIYPRLWKRVHACSTCTYGFTFTDTIEDATQNRYKSIFGNLATAVEIHCVLLTIKSMRL